MSSYTLELLRMDPWLNSGGGENNAGATDGKQRKLVPLPTPCGMALASIETSNSSDSKSNCGTTGAKVLAPHSYYECCFNVRVSSLLEHWLGPATTTNTATPTAKSPHCGLTTPPPSPPPPSPPASIAVDELFARLTAKVEDSETTTTTLIRQICCSDGCDISCNLSGLRLLNYLFKGNVQLTGDALVRASKLLVETGALKQNEVDEALISAAPILLQRKLFSEAERVVKILIEAGADPNVLDESGRSLLSVSVCHGDAAAGVSRTLLNAGALVCPVSVGDADRNNDVIDKLRREKESSAFAWLLKTLMDVSCGLDLDSAEETLRMICVSMSTAAEANDSKTARMKRHVNRTMLSMGKVAALNGPLFLRIKTTMAPYWSRPQSLRLQCLRRIRRSIGPKRLVNGGNRRLPLPTKLQKFVGLDSSASQTTMRNQN